MSHGVRTCLVYTHLPCHFFLALLSLQEIGSSVRLESNHSNSGGMECYYGFLYWLLSRCPVFMDGKPWKLVKPRTGDAATALIRAAGGDEVNQVQQAFYNGHYGFAGAKVQHVLQADRLCYSFTCPLHVAMQWCFRSLACLPCFLSYMSTMIQLDQ
jgi:hypothetical protein